MVNTCIERSQLLRNIVQTLGKEAKTSHSMKESGDILSLLSAAVLAKANRLTSGG